MCVLQVSKQEQSIMPIQESNAELSEKSGMLQAEKKLLEEDIKRWKARTQVSVNTHKSLYGYKMGIHCLQSGSHMHTLAWSLPTSSMFMKLG